MNLNTENPIVVETTRGKMVESSHRGAIAVVKSSGELVASWGDIDSLAYSRSSMKPFQAMATLETGAFEAFGLSAEKIALHVASHSGEAGHANRVMSAMCEHPWLVAGTDRPDTLLMQDSAFNGFAKCGAEAFFAMAFPEHDLGVAIKIDDGGDRAASVAAVAVLRKLGLLTQADVERLHRVANPELKTWTGINLGVIRAAAAIS